MPLNKSQLLVVNQTNFPDNNAQLITPSLLREFNIDMIDAMQLTQSMSGYAVLVGGNTFDGDQRIDKEHVLYTNGVYWDNSTIGYNNLEIINSAIGNVDISAQGGKVRIVNSPLQLVGSSLTSSNDISTSANVFGANIVELNISSSLALVTASFAAGTLTFTKGNGTTFGVVIPDVSGSTINTGSFATTGSNTFTGVNTFNERTSLQSINVYTGSQSGIYIGERTNFAPTTAGNVPGNQHSVIGIGALGQFGNGDLNTAFGANALSFLVSGSSNLAIGGFAGQKLVNGNTNTFIGDQAGNGIVGGDNNFFLGSSAGNIFRTGSYNIMIGLNTQGNLATGSGNLCIGSQAGTLIQNNVDNQLSVVYGTDLAPRKLLFKSGSEASNLYLYGGLEIQNTLTASLAEGFTYVGNASGRTIAVSTSSFASTINTGSFLTTGSINSFQNVLGTLSFNVSESFAGFGIQLFSTGSDPSGSMKFGITGPGNPFIQLKNKTWFQFGTNDELQYQSFTASFDNGIVVGPYYTAAEKVRMMPRSSSLQFNQDIGSGEVPLLQLGSIVYGVSSSIFFTPLDVKSTFTASLQQGHVFVGDSNGRTTTVATSSFGTSINTGSFATTGSNTFTGNQTITTAGNTQLNIISTDPNGQTNIDFQSPTSNFRAYGLFQINNNGQYGGSGSIQMVARNNNIVLAADGGFQLGQTNGIGNGIGAGAVTINVPTGSNTLYLTGSLNVSDTFTASLANGFTYVGDANGRTTTVATSSFGSTINTGSFATTGSNTFVGVETINSISGTGTGEVYLLGRSGSLILGNSTATPNYAALSHLSSSQINANTNLIFKTNSNTADTVVSGSHNLFVNPAAPTAGFKRYIGGSGNIALNASNVPQLSGSMAFSPTMNNNYFGGNSTTLTMRGPVSSSAYTISANSILGTVNIGSSAANNAEKLISGLTFTTNQIAGTLNVIANKTNLSSSLSFTGNNVIGTVTINANSSSVSMANNSINDASFNITNNFFSGSAGFSSMVASRNNIGGQANTLTAQGTASAAQSSPVISDNAIFGAGNTIFVDTSNSLVSGSVTYSHALRNIVAGNFLIITGSGVLADLSSLGSAYFGRYNAQDGNKSKTAQTVLAVGTGNATTRKTGFLIDSGSNTFVEGTLNVSGSTSMTGSLFIAPNFEARFATGSNQQAGTAVLDGASPGTVTVSNSLVTANSIIMVSKQTLVHTNGYVAVSAKSAGSFTITSNHNGDTDTVGWFIINNS